jgi:hypothetical protein
LRASHPALLAAGRAITEVRDDTVSRWHDWLEERGTLGTTISPTMLQRHLHLLVTMLAEMVGPMRREVKGLWFQACEHYGRAGATRGLAAGEVVEELTFLRDLLTRQLAPVLAAMRARQAMAIVLRLNRVLDKGIAVAVVGYTDALVATLFTESGVPAPGSEFDPSEAERQIVSLEQELAALGARR